MQKGYNKNRKKSNKSLVLKSAIWTLIAISLAIIGFFGAELLFG